MSVAIPDSQTIRKYRVLHVLPDLQMGGGQQVVLRIAERMDPDRFVNRVCYFLPPHDLRSKFVEAGVALDLLEHRGWWRWPQVLKKLIGLIRRERIDLVHVQGTVLDRRYGEFAAWCCGIPVIRTLHGMRLTPQSMAGRVKACSGDILDYILERRTIKHVMAVSDAASDSWMGYWRSRRIPDKCMSINYNGVPLDRYRATTEFSAFTALRRELKVDGAYPILINVGRLSEQKGHHLLVPMMLQVCDRLPNATLLLVGEGGYRATLTRRIHEAGLDQRIFLLGHRDDIPALLAVSDLFVFPSLREGLPLSVLEAMAASTPVVAFALPALRPIIQDGVTGYIVARQDAQSLAERVVEVVENRDESRVIASNGRRFVENGFSLQRHVERLEEIYLSILEPSTA